MKKNKKSHHRLIAMSISLLFSVVILLSISSSATAADKVIKWRLQSAWSPNSFTHAMAENFCADIKEETNGRMEVKLFAPGAILKPLEIFDGVKNGVIDMGFASGIYNARKIPEALVEFGMPFSFDSYQQTYEFLYEYEDGKVMKTIREAYKKRGVNLLVTGPGSAYGFMTTFPAKTLEDFKGKKIRSFGFFGALVKMMGGAPVNMPASEQYLALQRGTVEGTVFPFIAMKTYNIIEVANKIIHPPTLMTPTMNFIVNDKSMKKLPADLQEIVSRVALKNFKEYSETAFNEDAKTVTWLKENGGDVFTLPDADVAKLKKYGEKIWDGVGSKSENNKVLIGMLKSFLGRN